MFKKLGLFLYLFVGHYKCIDIIMHRKLQVNFQELKQIYWINIRLIHVRYSTYEGKPAG